MKIDKELCERFMATLPQQQIAFDGEKVIATNPHWLSNMITEALDGEDGSCEILASFVKSNMPIIKAYTNEVCSESGNGEDDAIAHDLFIHEIIIIFCFFVMKFAHKEEIERLRGE